jgi:hypothetical protein
MIRYDLVCDKGHEFDGWFGDSAAYDKQRKRGFVECTHCGSINVDKQIMAPNIGTKSNKKQADQKQEVMSAPLDPRAQMMLQMVKELRAHVEKTAENVGDRFVEEARKIHYNESEARGIYGSASIEDAKSLLEEGIDVMPLPRLPGDAN